MKRIERLHIVTRARVSVLTQLLMESKRVSNLEQFIRELWESEVDHLRTIEEIKKNRKLGEYYDIK